MEVNSKNRGRGRPRKIDDAPLREYFPNLSRRQRQNLYYAGAARTMLETLSGSKFDPIKHGWILKKFSILTELGRMIEPELNKPDEENQEGFEPGNPSPGVVMFVRSLEWLGENKPKTKDAVLYLRRYRTGKAPKADPTELANEVIDAINSYARRNPDLTRELIAQALVLVFGHAEREHAR